ncbi:AcrR family transcriptional regulator [Catenulispora sp. EB89]|uniref:TetR/AcrR family transcriptional regulator C-terminal domain-containing protein n=1 Tax=Catenulispora sp. EB89 TaxID=3156257 RepID=UPI003519416A
MAVMPTRTRRAPRRTDALTRDVIVQAATEILDADGEDALTLRALTLRLSTGYGAIYHHVADRDDLLAAATDDVIAAVVAAVSAPALDPAAAPTPAAAAGPQDTLRALALGLFDAVQAHPWVGAQLTREPWRPALLDVYECVSTQLQALGVPEDKLSDCAGALMNYIWGVAGQNAANARALAASNMDREQFLASVAQRWAQLDPARYPSMHRARTQLREHDDREQFAAGVDLILAGIQATIQAVHGSGAPDR